MKNLPCGLFQQSEDVWCHIAFGRASRTFAHGPNPSGSLGTGWHPSAPSLDKRLGIPLESAEVWKRLTTQWSENSHNESGKGSFITSIFHNKAYIDILCKIPLKKSRT